ncbi:MAG TPA: 16S rRNA (uracil(1498)-N(3))-methyltransferase [Burkholderiales bacterium]|nr:16S rRNA (uracil(1498)-N(3))-methyltransferase [Burkholderiales bacterium]
MVKELQKKPARPGVRFFYPGNLGSGAEVRLPADAAYHAVRVLRLSVGETVVLFNGQGGEFEARITRIGKGDVSVKTGAQSDPQRESALDLILAQGVSSGDRMDLTLQKSVELGVASIQPLTTERSIVRLSGERAARRAEHWQNLVIAACEQCGRNRVPQVAPLMRYGEWLGALPGQCATGELRLLLAPEATLPIRALPKSASRVILLAGPEGGFSAAEAGMAASRGFVAVRLGPRVLRTETAALAALAAFQALWGDF